ncbi:uncharacterized protein TrAtP1_007608 [Trichoderma atroviride]|uniref:uncharacterized protein n=1 Tax=Hypocrea atroviridis TaxID=63577 RepID=UPI00332A7B89|nr:hypothetical protein TrAtP1_007608 [Trichoderma atroviride]
MASSTAFSSMKWSLYPDDISEHHTFEVPYWARTVLLFDFAIFLPIIVILRYTLPNVYPVFAIIEDKSLEKEPIGDDSLEPNDVSSESLPVSRSDDDHGRTNTSSPSAIYRLLVKNGGVLANCRGLAFALLQTIPTTLYIAYHGRYLSNEYHIVARLFFSLLLVQFSTLWLHIVIAQTGRPFESRIPPLSVHSGQPGWQLLFTGLQWSLRDCFLTWSPRA